MSWVEDPGGDSFFGLNMTLLDIDTCYVKFVIPENIVFGRELYLYNKMDECINCPYTFSKYIRNESTTVINTNTNNNWLIKRNMTDQVNDEVTLCSLKPNFGEFGIYTVLVDETCTITTDKDPVNIYLSILTTILIVLGLTVVGYVIKCMVKHKQKSVDDDESTTPETKKKKRIQSLDTFRGISIALMIFVNYGGGHYEFIEHAVWNGLHVADLVFPWFMWIMGVCIPIAVKSALRRSSKTDIMKHITRRAVILFTLGLLLNSAFKFDNSLKKLRIFGVLQRFALCYLVVGTLNMIAQKKTDDTMVTMAKYLKYMIPQWIVVLVLVGIHTLCTFLVAKEGCPKGYLGPGGVHEYGKYVECVGGATGYIDEEFLTVDHLYQFPTSKAIYNSGPFDPEGFFGTFTSIFQVFLGLQAGSIILAHKSHKSRIIRWLIWAAVTGIIGGALCGFSKEDGVIPLNKNLWSLSFVLVTSSFAFILLTVCYVIIDVLHIWSGKPFVYPGMNATIMYVGHSLTSYAFPFQWGFTAMDTHFKYLITAIWGTTSWIIVAYWLYSIEFFLSL